jgi:hypothetical protein
MSWSDDGRSAMPETFLRMLILGVGAGLLCGWIWDLGLRPFADRTPLRVLVKLVWGMLPGVLYGLAISLPFARYITGLKTVGVIVIAMAGGIAFQIAIFIAFWTKETNGAGVLIAGAIGSVIFGGVASQRLRSREIHWPLGWYVLSGTLAGGAFLPHYYLLLAGPMTPSVHFSGYLGFVVWQGVTAATLAQSFRVPKARPDL